MFGVTYIPAWLVLTATVRPVAVFVTVMCAPGTKAAGSVTVPEKLAGVRCTNATAGTPRSNKVVTEARTKHWRRFTRRLLTARKRLTVDCMPSGKICQALQECLI